MPLDAKAIPVKTEAGRQLLTGRATDISRASRSFLIMVDGQRNMAQLEPIISSLGLSDHDLRDLVQAGWMDWRVAPRSAPRSASPRAANPSTPPRSEPVAETRSAPAVDTQAPADMADDSRTLAAAKFYALDLVARMLVGRDGLARAAAREVHDGPTMAVWISLCADMIRREAGEERAALFVEKMRQVLPEDDELITLSPDTRPLPFDAPSAQKE